MLNKYILNDFFVTSSFCMKNDTPLTLSRMTYRLRRFPIHEALVWMLVVGKALFLTLQ